MRIANRALSQIVHQRAGAALITCAMVWACGTSPSDPGDSGNDPPQNTAPVAAAGADQTVSIGLPVQLNGSATDADGDVLTYAWTLSTPDGSAASLDDAAAQGPTFVPDLAGAYVATLTASDGTDASAGDAVSISAADNTIAASVGAAGGDIGSSDGRLSLAIPAGALSDDTEIGVTLATEGQLPAPLVGIGTAAAYSLTPDGTQFATPITVSFEMDAEVTESATSTTLHAPLLMSESGGTLETLTGLTFALSETDPTKVVATGELGHFSFAAAVEVDGVDFTIEAPAEADKGEIFDVTLTLDISGVGVGGIVSASIEDLSSAAIEPEGELAATLLGDGAVRTIVNQYTCVEAGEGRIVTRVSFEAEQTGSLVTARFGQDITCVQPPATLETFFTELFAADRMELVQGTEFEVTVTGSGARTMNLGSGVVTVASDETGPEWLHRMSDGTFLVHGVLGGVVHVRPGADPVVSDTAVFAFDQARDARALGTDAVIVASAWGDLGVLRYNPATTRFTDAFRDPIVLGEQQDDTHLRALWVAEDQTVFGIETTGDGDAFGNDAGLVWIDLDEGTGAFNIAELAGDALNERLDPLGIQKDEKLTCRDEGGDQYLCMWSFSLSKWGWQVDVSTRGGGVTIFRLDASTLTTTRLRTANDPSRVAAGFMTSANGAVTYAVAVNQGEPSVEMWRVDGVSVAAEPAASFPIGAECPEPIDAIVLQDGERIAVTCRGELTGATPGVLVLQNPRLVVSGS